MSVMAATEMVRARIESGLKQRASAVLADMGLSMSDAIRMMLVRIAAERALPFEVRIPNRETEEALQAADLGQVKSFGSVASLMEDLND
jgi:DNA-damage-inducible protein J